MGFVFLDQYDIEACAAECNLRNADDRGGACQYFNIWRAVVDEKPTTYTCSLVGALLSSVHQADASSVLSPY